MCVYDGRTVEGTDLMQKACLLGKHMVKKSLGCRVVWEGWEQYVGPSILWS